MHKISLNLLDPYVKCWLRFARSWTARTRSLHVDEAACCINDSNYLSGKHYRHDRHGGSRAIGIARAECNDLYEL
eukprot:5406295-Pleurochrysis_carterae.AAC.3